MTVARPLLTDSLARLSRQQAANLGFLGRMGEILACLGPSIESVLTRYAGERVRIRVVVPRSPADLDSRPPAGGWSGIAACLRCLGPAASILVLVPGGLGAAMAGAVLGCGVLPPSADPALGRAVLLHFLCDVVRCLPTGLPVLRVDSVTDAPDIEALPQAGQGAVIHVRVTVRDRTDIATLAIPWVDLPALSAAVSPGGMAGAGAAIRGIRCPVHMVTGAATLPLDEIERLEPDDVLLLDRSSGSVPTGCDLAVRTRGSLRFLARAAVDGSRLRIVQGGPSIMEEGLMNETEERTAIQETPGVVDGTGAAGPAAIVAREIPAEVVVEAGRVAMTVGQLLDLAPGTVIPLDRPPSMEVALSVGGKVVAHGVLVDVEGDMGVQVRKFPMMAGLTGRPVRRPGEQEGITS